MTDKLYLNRTGGKEEFHMSSDPDPKGRLLLTR